MIKIAIADDNRYLIRAMLEKLAAFDDLTCSFTAENGRQLLAELEKHRTVDLVLMDIEMPLLNGIEATALVKQRYPQIKVIILTVFDHYEHIANAIKAGADGYVLKELAPDELYKAITDVLNGGVHMSPSVALKTFKMFRDPETYLSNTTQAGETNSDNNPLTERELDVLRQLATGLKYEEIAGNLFLSVGTVRKHIENLYAKLQVHNKLEAIQKARSNKLL